MLSVGRRHTCAEDIYSEMEMMWMMTNEAKKCGWTYLRPDHSLEDGITFIRAEAVPVEIIKEIVDPEDAESPQVLQWTDAAWAELQMTDNTVTLGHRCLQLCRQLIWFESAPMKLCSCHYTTASIPIHLFKKKTTKKTF